MKNYLKRSFVSLLIACIASPIFSQAGLYTPEQQKLLITRLNHVISYQQHIFNALPSESRLIQSFHTVDLEMKDMSSHDGALLAKVIDNCFVLKLFPKIEEFLISEFRRKELGKPFITYLPLNDPMEVVVVSGDPTKDAHLDSSSTDSKVVKILETNEGIQHFDQQFRTYVYRIAFDRGLMVRRGSYLYVDSDLNGIPESLYFLGKYRDKNSKYHIYAKTIGNGENIIRGTAYHERYLDALFMVMDYIMKNFPFERYEIHEDYAQAL